MNTPLEAYRAASESAVFIDRTDRVRLAITGPDRAKFLHNLTTNEIKRLALGRGVEAFVTSPQGKTLGFATFLAEESTILARMEPAAITHVLPHFQKYGVFDDVAIEDVSANTFEFHVAGPHAEEIIRQATANGPLPETADLRHIVARINNANVRLIRETVVNSPGLTLIGDRTDADKVHAAIEHAGNPLGLLEPDAATYAALRIEGGTPLFGADINVDSLPQEVARDARAINFVKGCYLGQETVARIDALGHVNKLLRGFQSPGAIKPGDTIEAEGKPIGTITSAAWSSRSDGIVALGYIKTSHAKAGTKVAVGAEKYEAIVCDLPMQSHDSRS